MTVPSGPARRIRHWVLLVVLIWAALAYVMAPRLWTHHGEQPGIRSLPKVTLTARGLPGDPMDVGLVGTREDVVRAMAAAGWHAAAPAGQLSYAGRLPDLAFEAESVDPAGRRDSLLLWKVLDLGAERQPVWLGSAVATGTLPPRLDPDVDAARDRLIDDLDRAGMLTAIYQVTGLGPVLLGRNGEGERYRTDGEIRFGRLVAGGRAASQPATVVAPPPFVGLKDRLWRALGGLAGG
ncbi:LssY C-terminal domain-containing protein [Ancylobacter sp. Lp-2]|uniref:LssY C-terminal domain-containing protein n=1 Tax=Ancylobacter sp. Lp-2 TaxID=2881339 RepID=UPI001E335E77|nr:LssY C-terminal domain-containing protein [Ancylobacter sp. Lp-2]MCB4771134.1 LssY C-terminal domain-containing protein [Ancylobacter sp. Lp-2]